jgi:hypothetical protein
LNLEFWLTVSGLPRFFLELGILVNRLRITKIFY